MNAIEINFIGVGFVCIRMTTFFLEVTLHRRFIFRFIWDNDLFFGGIFLMQPLIKFLKMVLMLSKNASEKIKSVSFSTACQLPSGFFNTPVSDNTFMA